MTFISLLFQAMANQTRSSCFNCHNISRRTFSQYSWTSYRPICPRSPIVEVSIVRQLVNVPRRVHDNLVCAFFIADNAEPSHEDIVSFIEPFSRPDVVEPSLLPLQWQHCTIDMLCLLTLLRLCLSKTWEHWTVVMPVLSALCCPGNGQVGCLALCPRFSVLFTCGSL